MTFGTTNAHFTGGELRLGDYGEFKRGSAANFERMFSRGMFPGGRYEASGYFGDTGIGGADGRMGGRD